MKAVGIDFGLKRTGFAITDDLGIIATPLETVDSVKLEEFLEMLVQKEKVECIVIGFPLALDGSDTDITHNVRILHQHLKAKYPDIQLVLYDERMTSTIAKKTMIQIAGKKQRREKGHIDKISAGILLQDYLNSSNSFK